jgi:hypothetical protein
MIADRAAPRYRAYLLRFWQERRRSGAGAPVWRFSLEDPHTGARHGFATLKELVAMLEHTIEDPAEAQHCPHEGLADTQPALSKEE